MIANKWNIYQKKVQEEYIKEDVSQNKKRFINVNDLTLIIRAYIIYFQPAVSNILTAVFLFCPNIFRSSGSILKLPQPFTI